MWQHQSSPLEEAEPGDIGYVVASKTTSTGRSGLKLRDMWQRRSSPQQRGEVWNHGKDGRTGVHLGREARSGATGHVAATEPTSAGRRGLELYDMWQCVDALLAHCLDLKLVCGGTQSTGYHHTHVVVPFYYNRDIWHDVLSHD
jgi:hypothetical protein